MTVPAGRRLRSAPLVVAPLMIGVALGACGGSSVTRLPDVPGAGSVTTATTAPVAVANVVLPAVGGSTTSSIDMSPGKATLEGTVSGPDGPVPGAKVRADWLVGDAVIPREAVSGGDGTWKLANIKGGRYRVRAWRSPDMAQLRSELLLLAGDETKRLDFRLEHFGGLDVDTALAPNPPVVDETVNLVVRVATREVDDDGIVRETPMAGTEVELFGSGSWTLRSGNPVTTGSSGDALFTLSCRAEGPNDLSVLVAGAESAPLNLAACVVRPPSTTTSSTSTTRPRQTTSTTRRATTSSTSTTTTTEPE